MYVIGLPFYVWSPPVHRGSVIPLGIPSLYYGSCSIDLCNSPPRPHLLLLLQWLVLIRVRSILFFSPFCIIKFHSSLILLFLVFVLVRVLRLLFCLFLFIFIFFLLSCPSFIIVFLHLSFSSFSSCPRPSVLLRRLPLFLTFHPSFPLILVRVLFLLLPSLFFFFTTSTFL